MKRYSDIESEIRDIEAGRSEPYDDRFDYAKPDIQDPTVSNTDRSIPLHTGTTRAQTKTEYKKQNSFFGIFVLLFFIGDVIAIMVYSKSDLRKMAVCLGLLFTVLGMIAFSGSRGTQKFGSLPFIAVGLGCITVPCMMMYEEKNPGTFSFDNIQELIPYLFLGMFSVVGAGIIIGTIAGYFSAKKHCTDMVEAECIDLERRRHKNHYNYRATWRYTYNGTLYTYRSPISTNISVPQIGEKRELPIDPDKPEKLDDMPFGGRILSLIVGTVFFVSGLFSMWMMNSPPKG